MGDEASEFADRAAATVAAVTGKDVASALSDAALADAAKDPDSVLAATEKADLKDLYEKVLAALKGSGYAMKGDSDKASVSGKGKGKKGKDKGGKGDAAAAAGADAAADAKDAAADAKDGGADAKDGGADAKDGGADGDTEAVVYDDDENLGDPVDQTKDDPYEFHVPDYAPYSGCDITSRTALDGIPEDASNNEKRHLQEKVVRRLSLIRPGENVWQAEERLGEDFPADLRIHTKTKISQIYRKLDPDKPAYTVTAAGGGGTFMYHWTDRELTNRERARLQTFPDDYTFYGKYSSVRKQIGMAVPCRLSEIVTTAVLNTFAGIEYPWIEANLAE